jgi:hypothetical protein
MSAPEYDESWMGPLPAAPGCECHLCRPDPSYYELDRRTIDTVLEHGWQVILVAADAARGLGVGGSRPALESFIAFRGREPQLDALLRHSGMSETV